MVARSSAEEEFRVMKQGVCELLWLKRALNELHVDVEELMRLLCDNKAGCHQHYS